MFLSLVSYPHRPAHAHMGTIPTHSPPAQRAAGFLPANAALGPRSLAVETATQLPCVAAWVGPSVDPSAARVLCFDPGSGWAALGGAIPVPPAASPPQVELALDGQDQPVLAINQPAGNATLYGYSAGGASWAALGPSLPGLAADGDFSMALGPGGIPYLAVQAPSAVIFTPVHRLLGGGWEALDGDPFIKGTPAPTSLSLVLSSRGQVVAAFRDADRAKVATW